MIPQMGRHRVAVRTPYARRLMTPHLRTELSRARRCDRRAHARLAQTRYHGLINPVATYRTERWHCT